MSNSPEKAPREAAKHEQKVLKRQPEVNIGTNC